MHSFVAEGPEHLGLTSLGKSSALARYPFLSAASLFPCVDPSLPVIETSFIAKHLSVYKLFHRQTHQDWL